MPSLTLLGHAFDQVLGFLQAQAGRGADDLDDADLLVAEAFEDDVELGLARPQLRQRRRHRRRASHHHGAAGGRLDAVDVLQVVAQFLGLLQRQADDLVAQVFVAAGEFCVLQSSVAMLPFCSKALSRYWVCESVLARTSR